MNIALLAPSPVPLAIGGAENLWWGLLEHLNEHTHHHADLIKLPTPERDFWEIVDSYRRWSELDVTGYDAVISGKYPAWMAAHPRHVIYLLHPLRGLYDTYPADWPIEVPSDDAEVVALGRVLTGPATRDALAEGFARLERLRHRDDLPTALFGLPGPLIRQVVRFFDLVGRAPEAIARSVALSATVAARDDYFPGADGAVPIAHAPTRLRGLHSGFGRALFTVSRLDRPKRIDLLIAAMAHVRGRVELQIAGTGPDEPRLRELADDPRITFRGHLSAAELTDAYARARAVLFAPLEEDYGYITLEAMLSGAPVITTTDSGGPTELVRDGITGRIVPPAPEAIGAAIEEMLRHPLRARQMGRAGRRAGRVITWGQVTETLLGGLGD